MSKSMVQPSEILVTLKQRDDANASTMKTIYNARHKYKVAEKAGRSQMQQLLGQLALNKYIEWHRNCVDTEIVTDLFFAHPTSLNLLRAFPKVLLMDCTYKTNQYRLRLVEIVGVTSTVMTFSVAFAYLQYEKEDNYTWALGILRSVMDENTLPSIIVIDRELALMNAICTVFPGTTNLLCRWHIRKNVLVNCKKMVESSHAKLKRYLESSQENLESNWTRIHNLLELQHSEIKSSFEKSKIVVQHDFKPTQFKELRVKSNPRGRPKLKIETSTHREPSAFEIIASAQDSYSLGVIAKASVTTKKVKTKKTKKVHRLRSLNPNCFLEAFPSELRRCIKYVKDVTADGNFGFRAVAGLMGFGEEGWLQVRKDLLKELHAHSDHYRKLSGSQERIDDLTNILAYFEPNPGLDRWMTMPDMGHLISSFYQVVLVHLSMQQCLTFLPLRSIPTSVASRKEICIGFVNNNHFV
ncbi:hypothetical protein ACSBR2_025178 [Camellia fascicularis]